MTDYKELRNKIEQLREHLHKLIEEKSSLVDPEVIAASRMLDTLLNEYDRLIKGKDM